MYSFGPTVEQVAKTETYWAPNTNYATRPSAM